MRGETGLRSVRDVESGVGIGPCSREISLLLMLLSPLVCLAMRELTEEMNKYYISLLSCVLIQVNVAILNCSRQGAANRCRASSSVSGVAYSVHVPVQAQTVTCRFELMASILGKSVLSIDN